MNAMIAVPPAIWVLHLIVVHPSVVDCKAIDHPEGRVHARCLFQNLRVQAITI
jgi:hypothetical protein